MAGETAVENPPAQEVTEEKKEIAEAEAKEAEAGEKQDEGKEKTEEKKEKKVKKEKVKKEKVEKPPPPPPVHKKDFEKDVVYVFQFNRTPKLPSISPYCLKLETWLKLQGIKYEVNIIFMTHLSRPRTRIGVCLSSECTRDDAIGRVQVKKPAAL